MRAVLEGLKTTSYEFCIKAVPSIVRDDYSLGHSPKSEGPRPSYGTSKALAQTTKEQYTQVLCVFGTGNGLGVEDEIGG